MHRREDTTFRTNDIKSLKAAERLGIKYETD